MLTVWRYDADPCAQKWRKMRKICCGPVFNFKDVTANLAIYVDSTAPNLTIRSQTMSIEFKYIIPLLVNNLVETTLI